METLANVFLIVLFIVISGVGGQYLFNVHVEFIVNENCLVCLTSSKQVYFKLQFTVWIVIYSYLYLFTAAITIIIRIIYCYVYFLFIHVKMFI